MLAKHASALAAAALSVVMTTAMPPAAHAGEGESEGHIRHVLLISIDGMHALDYENCVNDNTCPVMASLGKHGVTYTRTSTSRPSDSFPGLMAIVTGGSPKSVGAFYDVAYDRTLAPPTIETGNGNPPGACVEGHKNGATTEYEEGNEIDQTQLNGGSPDYTLTDGGIKSIDPRKLNRDPFNHCNPVYAWNFIRTNSIYGVIHNAGGYTAWSDKHAAYAAVNGHTDGALPSNVDDYYSPEVNSNVIPLPSFSTVLGDDCSVVDPAAGDWTTSFKEIRCYDQLKVNAVLNWIHGKTHLGDASLPPGVRAPVIFGMNFQAVSVGQKLIENGVKGGYKNAAGDPTTDMQNEITFADRAIGQMVTALKNQGLFESTTIIITAKHGQSPVDPNRFFPIPGHSGNNGTPPSGIIPSFLPAVYNDSNNGLGLAEDDISQIWLADSSRTADAVTALENAATTIGLGQILYGPSLNTIFNPPGVPNTPGPCCRLREGGDPRTPDIVVLPNIGVVYTGNLKKQSEHGGFALDDTNVMLLVSNPHMASRTVN